MITSPLEWALESLEGLSVGDAFGQCFFEAEAQLLLESQTLPAGPWFFTDDTIMSLSVVSILREQGVVDQEKLALSFANHYAYDRAYGPSMHHTLSRIREGASWQEVASSTFGGQGSYGNGAAMRSAPLGAFFAGDREAIVHQATLCAEVTHAHPEGIAGAIAVALASGEAVRARRAGECPSASIFLSSVIEGLPVSEVRSKLIRAKSIESLHSLPFAISLLGNGSQMSAQDTVPYALWCCAQSLPKFSEALWLAVQAGGDRDTLCAIVGGIVGAFVGKAGIPEIWRARRETLPRWHLGF